MSTTIQPGSAASTPVAPPTLTVGAVLVGIAAIHQIVGVAIGLGLDPNMPFVGTPPLQAIARAGVVASVGNDAERGAITWFLLWGFLLASLGVVLHQSERAGQRPTRTFALLFAAMCTLGVVLMPASGFWLGIAPVLLALRRSAPG